MTTTPQFVVTLSSATDITGLRRMTLREAAALVDFIALHYKGGARILPAEHSAICACAYCTGKLA